MAEALRLPSFYGLGSARATMHSNRELSSRQWSRVRALESPSWLKQCYDRVAELAVLSSNWDSYQSVPPSKTAIDGARLLLSNLEMDDLPTPQILPVAEGGVGFHWRVANHDLEIEIESPNIYRFLKTIVGEREIEPEVGVVNDVREVQFFLDWLLERR